MSLIDQLNKAKNKEVPETIPPAEETPPVEDVVNTQDLADASIEEETPVETGTFYEGEFRLLNSHASPIAKQGLRYLPKDEDEVACLEYQVSQGRVTKIVK